MGGNDASGGRTNPTESTAVWRFHQLHHNRSYTKCFNCGARTNLRLRKEGEIRPLCIHHFCTETGASEEIMKTRVNGEEPARPERNR